VPDGPLAEVCPATITIQTTGEPGVGLGALYRLTGSDAAVEATKVSGSFSRPDGVVDDVLLEVRTGGPATGFRDAVTVASTDDAITLVHTSISSILEGHGRSPMVAVAALTDRSRQAILVDPSTYPDVSDIAGVAAADIEIRHFTDSPAFEFLGTVGPLSGARLVDGFDGGPAAFVAAGGTIAQQGDLLVDPGLFVSLPQWARPVTAIALSAAGWADHDDVLAVRADDGERLSDCLARVVPIVQQAIVAYAEDPSPTNDLITRARAASDPLSRVTADLLDAGAADSIALDVVGNGVDGTIGDIDTARLGDFLPELANALGIADVAVDDIADNRFIDPSVGF